MINMKKKIKSPSKVETGFQLRKWREDNDLTREELAVAIGKGSSTIYRIERDNKALERDFLILINSQF